MSTPTYTPLKEVSVPKDGAMDRAAALSPAALDVPVYWNAMCEM
jgi:hypothetical protein